MYLLVDWVCVVCVRGVGVCVYGGCGVCCVWLGCGVCCWRVCGGGWWTVRCFDVMGGLV